MKFFALAAMLAAGVLVAFVPGAGGRSLNSQTYGDPAGDAQGAPDITSLTINDSPSGVVQFAFTVTGMVKNSAVMLYLDTDRNATTGDEGWDYEVELSVATDGKYHYDVTRYDGADWVEVPDDGLMGMSVTGNVWTVRTGKAAIGTPTGFAFWGVAAVWDANDDLVALDRLPDAGQLSYDLSTSTTTKTTTTTPPPAFVQPWIGKPTITPAPKAGATVTVTFPVTNKATGAPLTSGTMMCDPQVNGKVLAHQESFGNGTAKLRFKLPKSAKGKTLKVNLTIRVGSKSAHTTATYKVR